MFICTHCGHLVEEPRVVRENHGLAWGYEEFYAFCSCGGEYEEAVECEECGEYFAEDDTHITDGDMRRLCFGCEIALQEPEIPAKLAV